jgi:hypothetical protein
MSDIATRIIKLLDLEEAVEAECDHDWIDESEAGPDSGNIDMTCRKCGKVCYVNLY